MLMSSGMDFRNECLLQEQVIYYNLMPMISSADQPGATR
jgi:hypothetical protein